jgi:hypothetical protein
MMSPLADDSHLEMRGFVFRLQYHDADKQNEVGESIMQANQSGRLQFGERFRLQFNPAVSASPQTPDFSKQSREFPSGYHAFDTFKKRVVDALKYEGITADALFGIHDELLINGQSDRTVDHQSHILADLGAEKEREITPEVAAQANAEILEKALELANKRWWSEDARKLDRLIAIQAQAKREGLVPVLLSEDVLSELRELNVYVGSRNQHIQAAATMEALSRVDEELQPAEEEPLVVEYRLKPDTELNENPDPRSEAERCEIINLDEIVAKVKSHT